MLVVVVTTPIARCVVRRVRIVSVVIAGIVRVRIAPVRGVHVGSLLMLEAV